MEEFKSQRAVGSYLEDHVELACALGRITGHSEEGELSEGAGREEPTPSTLQEVPRDRA